MRKKIKVILLVVLILMGAGVGTWWYQHQKNQEIYQLCFQKSLRKVGSYSLLEVWGFSSINDCATLIKNLGGIDEFNKPFKEIIAEKILEGLRRGEFQLPEGMSEEEFIEKALEIAERDKMF